MFIKALMAVLFCWILVNNGMRLSLSYCRNMELEPESCNIESGEGGLQLLEYYF